MTTFIIDSIKYNQDGSESSEMYIKYCKAVNLDDRIEAGGIGNAVSFLEILRLLEIFCTFENIFVTEGIKLPLLEKYIDKSNLETTDKTLSVENNSYSRLLDLARPAHTSLLHC